jgi:Mechanosensitive ion channel, beta-domain
MGDVEVVRLLVTHLRTVKNEEVIISNSTILRSEIINYSSLARERGLILHTMVGIGYDIPGGRSMAMLLEAALTPIAGCPQIASGLVGVLIRGHAKIWADPSADSFARAVGSTLKLLFYPHQILLQCRLCSV